MKLLKAAILGPSLLLLMAPCAMAQSSHSGNAGMDQYIEGTPSVSGEIPGGHSNGGNINPSTESDLANAGPAGSAAAALAESTAPARLASGRGAQLQGDSSGEEPSGMRSNLDAPAAESGGSSAFGLIGDGTGGMGIVFPLFLILVAAAAIVFAVRRHRPGAPPSE